MNPAVPLSLTMSIGWKQIATGLLVLVLLLALGLRFHRLGVQSLWNDEGSSVALAQRDLATIARDASHDIHPPLYYWLLSGWVRLFGTQEAAVRSLSALLGVALVAQVYALGRLLAGPWAGLAAAALAAISPFQVYYSQEARMYMLLAVLGALAFYAALRWAASEPWGGPRRWGVLYIVAGAAGLYTHYAFPIVLVAVNLVVLLDIAVGWRQERSARHLARWIALQVGVALFFVPWLPTAYRQLTTWPRMEGSPDLVAALQAIGQLFLVGPAAPPLVENVAVVLLLTVAFFPARRNSRLPALTAGLAPVLWLAVPVTLILGLGLFKEAYLKFLLIGSPAFCLLAGRLMAAPLRGEGVFRSLSAAGCILLALFLAYSSASGLHSYYDDPAYARDDYRRIAAYVSAVGQPGDAILLDAPGQQEVFGYYYHGDLPVYPLPQSRPLDPAATETALRALAQPGGQVLALLWATDESDPERFVEGWLDSHAYKALDSWYGNVRLVVYAVPEQTPGTPDRALDDLLQSATAGDEIKLLGYSLLDDRLAAGDIAQITLFWQADRATVRRYKVFIHLLDGNNHIVGQRDAEPGGGARLTTLWKPGEVVADNYGLPIHPATPPGQYRVEVGMYDLETGQRLTTPDGASEVGLEPLRVERPLAPAPAVALGMQHASGASFDGLVLLGYDAYRLGLAHQPDEPLRPGDVLHVNLYWQAGVQPSGDWRLVLALVGSDAKEWASLTAEPVESYPTNRWQAGDVWRGQFDLALPGDLPAGRYRLRVQPVAPGNLLAEPFLSGPLSVVR